MIVNSPKVNKGILTEEFDRSHSIKTVYNEFPENCLVIGLGGIGSQLCPILASLEPIKRILMFDNDKVELSNLSRTSYQYQHLNKFKVSAMAQIISSSNVGIEALGINKKFNKDTIEEILSNEEMKYIFTTPYMVFDCRDDYFGDYDLFETIKTKIGKPLQYALLRAAYNAMSITIDTNPDKHPVWGRGGYNTQTQSHSIPSRLVALLAVMIAANYNKYKEQPPIVFEVDDLINFIIDGTNKKSKK